MVLAARLCAVLCAGHGGWRVMSESQRIGTKRVSDRERLDQALKLWRADLDKLIADNNELLEVVKLAYRKHHLGDESVGWDELSEAMQNVLCETMGDKQFVDWLKEMALQ